MLFEIHMISNCTPRVSDLLMSLRLSLFAVVTDFALVQFEQLTMYDSHWFMIDDYWLDVTFLCVCVRNLGFRWFGLPSERTWGSNFKISIFNTSNWSYCYNISPCYAWLSFYIYILWGDWGFCWFGLPCEKIWRFDVQIFNPTHWILVAATINCFLDAWLPIDIYIYW